MRNRPRSGNGKRAGFRAARQNGLTLIELLVAITILSFIAIMGWRGLDSIVRARIALTSDLENTRGMQLAFAQLQSDCGHLYSSAALPDRMPLIAEPGKLRLVRTVFADSQPSRLQVVTYRVMDGVLTRHESSPTRDLKELGVLWRSAETDTRTNPPVVLQSGVTAMTIRLWTNGGWRTISELSQPGAPSAPTENPPPAQALGTSPLPTGLEVAMQLQGEEKSLLKVFLLGAV